ncbi:MAG: hypothetical protein ABIG95_03125 [Candidatus Woesearchaeota archaeon]
MANSSLTEVISSDGVGSELEEAARNNGHDGFDFNGLANLQAMVDNLGLQPIYVANRLRCYQSKLGLSYFDLLRTLYGLLDAVDCDLENTEYRVNLHFFNSLELRGERIKRVIVASTYSLTFDALDLVQCESPVIVTNRANYGAKAYIAGPRSGIEVRISIPDSYGGSQVKELVKITVVPEGASYLMKVRFNRHLFEDVPKPF